MLTERGFLVLADITGFTAFVTRTEIVHGAEVTGLLLETVMWRLSPPLEIQELEGDAVFAIGPDSIAADDGVSAAAERAFAAFREQQGALARDHSCRCAACRSVPELSLKMIVHHGRFVRQTVGGRPRVTGPDVILVHRLLKNEVGAGTYLLLTASALACARLDPDAADMRPYVAAYPHLGTVSCYVHDLGPVPAAG
jgi:hypothetical protein